MKFGVVVFPGSNCDQDMHDALKHDLGQEVEMLWHKDKDLSSYSTDDCIVLPGGFSFGDYLRCGAMARFSPIMESVIEFANKGGKVLGVCNGFQVLCEAELLPGALLANDHQKFICKNVFLTPQSKSAAITSELEKERAYKIPIAHGEGRFYSDEETLKELVTNDQILFTYCDQAGIEEGEINPNGSIMNIAGITNKAKNVFGMMPHPERACNDVLGNIDGRKFFEGIINMKCFLSLLVLLLVCSFNMNAQNAEDLVKWEIKISKTEKKNEYIVSATAKMEAGWHLFGQKPGDDFLIPTHFEFENGKTEIIKVDELGSLKTEVLEGVGTIHYYEKKVSFNALVRSMDSDLKGFIEFQVCNATMCLPPTQENFSLTVK